MAKPKKKKAAKSQAGPLAALYGLDAGTERGDAVRAVLAGKGVRVRTVQPKQLADPVGFIAGMATFRPSPVAFDGEPPTDEFMLLANMGSKALDALLAAMRETGSSVDCKAVVTKHNRTWPFIELMERVHAEHDGLTAR